MKKIIFILAVLFICALSANAQKHVVDYDNLEALPSQFTYAQTPYLLFTKEKEGSISDEPEEVFIYDMNFNMISSFRFDEDAEYLDCDTYVDKSGYEHDVRSYSILTQTFFNDDPDWEYIVPVMREVTYDDGYDSFTYMTVVSYTIKKTNGTVIGSIPADKWSVDYCVFGDNVYVEIYERHEGDDYRTKYFYTLPEFRKLISNDPNGVKPVAAMTQTISKEAYDLMGRKASDRHKGIVIKDGKKMINK